MSERGQHRRGAPPSAARRSRSTPTMPTRSSTSPSSNSTPAISPKRARWWARYLELDEHSEWARTAARGIQFVDLQLDAEDGRLRWRRTFLFDGPEDARVTILLAHGAGAPMDSASMTATAQALAAAGFRVARFEFGYMASRRTADGRKPPPRAETLNPEYDAAIAELGAKGPLIIGGKSMGGRVASMVADELLRRGQDRRAALPRLSVPSARQAAAAAHQAPRRPEDADADLPGHARRVRHARRGRRLRAFGRDRDALAGGRRPRPQAAQERVGLLGRRSSEDGWPRQVAAWAQAIAR